MGHTSIDSEIDRLYGLALEEFTKERDALARRLRADGNRDDAASVAELRKPVLAAWVVNRLARKRRADVEALVEAAAAIRAGKPDADERFRTTADGLARAAREVLAEADRRPSDAVLRDVATTLRAASAADPDVLLAGRLTEPVEATGFEAMAGAAPRRPASSRGPPSVEEEAAARPRAGPGGAQGTRRRPRRGTQARTSRRRAPSGRPAAFEPTRMPRTARSPRPGPRSRS